MGRMMGCALPMLLAIALAMLGAAGSGVG